jgi:PKD repeat protein
MKLSRYSFILLFVLCLLFIIPATVSATKHIFIYPELPEPFNAYGWDTNVVGYSKSLDAPNLSFFEYGGAVGRCYRDYAGGDCIERMFMKFNLTDLNASDSNIVGTNVTGWFETFSVPVTVQFCDADWGELLTSSDWNSYQSLLGQKTFSAYYSDQSSIPLGNSILGKNAQILVKSGDESSGLMGLSDLFLDIEVKTPPTADFETVPISGMSPLKVRFIDTSIVDGRRVQIDDLISTVWQYKRSDGAWTTFTLDEDSCFVFTDPGNYDIKIIENGIDGSDSVTKSISVTPMNPLVIDDAIGKIAFVSDRNGINEIFVMNANGSGQTNLHAVGTSPEWSPDGTKIAFESNYMIYVMNADGSDQICLTPGIEAWDPLWSPDGTKIAYLNGGVCVMNADGSGKTQIHWGLDAAWSPDGTKIATGYPGIWVVDANGMNPIRLVPFNTYSKEVLPIWSPDGTKIAFMRYYLPRPGLPPELPSEIFAINADGSGETNLTKTPTAYESSPKWSPDGTKIAYISDYFNLYVMNTDGSEKTFLTSATERILQSSTQKNDFSWSPDSTKIAFTTTPMNINKEIYVVNAGGPELIQLTHEGNNMQPSWGYTREQPPLVAAFEASPISGPAPFDVQFTDKSTGNGITSRVWEYKINTDSTWTTFTLDGDASFTFTESGTYDIKLTVTGHGGSDAETKTDYIDVQSGLGTVSFDKNEYTDINGCTRVKVIDPSLNNPNKPDEVTVTITSLDTITRELIQKNLVLYEEGINSGIFTNAFVYNPPLPAGIWVSSANPGAFSATYNNAKEPAIATYKFSGGIQGRVMKGIWENGNIIRLDPVENAQVYAYKSGAHAGKEVYTNAQGLYKIDSLDPGTYEVTANFDGADNGYIKMVEVKINQISSLDFPSNIEGIQKAITKLNAAQNYIRLRQAYMEHSWSVYRIGLSANFASLLKGISEIAAHSAYDLYAHLYGAALDLPGDPIENAKDRADQAIAQLGKIMADPPDTHYNETYQVCATAQIDLPTEYQGTLLGSQIGLANALANQTAVDDALLVSFERYQGALDAGDLDSVYLQLDALEHYSSLLKTNSTVLETRAVDFRNIIQSEKLDHQSDLDALHQNLATEGINLTERDQLKALNMTDEDIDLYQEVLMNLSYDELLRSADGFIEYAQNRSEFAHSFELQIKDIRIQINQIPPPLVANFTSNVTTGTSPLVVQFNDTSTGGPAAWHWEFGDGGNSTVRNATHVYHSTGTFTVNLAVTNATVTNTASKTGYINVTSEIGVLPLPGFSNPPTDPDGDGLYEDLNANNRKDFNDVVLMFNQMQWIAANEPVTAFDFNGNDRIDFNDIVKLFGEI